MKKYIALTLFITISVVLFSQDKQMFNEKFRIGLNAVSLNYVGSEINVLGYRLDVGVPIYRQLSANASVSQLNSYFDYCEEVPVEVSEAHFVTGLSYTFLEIKNWTLNALIGIDLERTRYKEVDELPENASVFHEAGAHEENHNYAETFIEGVMGVEANFTLSKHFYLNASSRMNTYGAFQNSMGLGYIFEIKR